MVDRRRKQRLEIDKSPFDTSAVRPGSSAVGVQPTGGIGAALVGLGISRAAIPAISKKGQTLYGLLKNPSTGRLVVEKLSNIPQSAMSLVRNVIKSTPKKVPTVNQAKTGAKTNFKSTPKSKAPINNAQRETKEQVDNLVKVKQISKQAGNRLKRLINKVPTPALLNFIKNPKAVAGVGAGVVGAGGLTAYIANLSSNKDEADAAMQLVNSNFPAYGDMIRGGREQAKIAAEEARGIFRTRRVLDDATKEKISRMRNLPPNMGAMIPIENKLNPYGESVVERGVYGPRNVFEEQRDVAARRARFQPRITETRGTGTGTGDPQTVIPGPKPFRTPEGADVIEAFRDTVPADDTIAEDIIGQKLFGLRRTKREINRDELLTRNLAGETVTFKGKKYKPGQIDSLVKATKISGPSKTARTKDDPDRVKTVREDVARVLRPNKKMMGGKVYASTIRKPKTIR
tara:strand:- start:189 stop:1562 length:1374 start_codon:yes stop_codon:yes gene_type:complete